MQKPLRIAFAASMCVAAASIVLRYALEPGKHPRRESTDLTLSFVGYSNGMAIVELKNSTQKTVQLAYGYIEILFQNPTNDSTFAGEPHRVNSSDVLTPGGSTRESFPTPTNGLCWRATVAAFDGREFDRKKTVERSWVWRHRPRWLFKQYPKLEYVHADTVWIAP